MGGFNELLSFVRTMSCGAFSVLSWLGFRRVIWLIYLASLSRIGAQSTGSISEYYATDPLQLLFGKFRDWDNIRLIHFIIFSLALFAVIGIYMPVLGFRAQKWKRLSQKIPNTDWIQHEALETLLTVQVRCMNVLVWGSSLSIGLQSNRRKSETRKTTNLITGRSGRGEQGMEQMATTQSAAVAGQ